MQKLMDGTIRFRSVLVLSYQYFKYKFTTLTLMPASYTVLRRQCNSNSDGESTINFMKNNSHNQFPQISSSEEKR